MPISQEKLGRFAVIRRYRWALAGSIFWLVCALIYITFVVLSLVKGKPIGFQEVLWLILSLVFMVQNGISLVWHRRERAVGRIELV